MSKSLLSNEKKCYLTGRTDNLEQHHIMHGNANRKLADKWGCWVYLTSEMHRGTYGVHGKYGHDLDIELKKACQIAFERLYGHEKWMQVFGKNYKEETHERERDN